MRIEYSKWSSARADCRLKSRALKRVLLAAALAMTELARAHLAEAKPVAQNNALTAKLLNQMANAERSANYSATQTFTRRDSIVRVRIWRLGRQRRVEYLEPAINRGDVLVDDGQHTWMYHRAENAAIETRSQNERNSGGLASRRTARLGGESKIDGRAVSVVDVLRPAGGKVARRIWIDRATKLRLSTQFFDAQNQSAGRMTISDLKLGGVQESRFRWQPPAGAQIVRTEGALFSQFALAKQAASWLQSPSFVPASFRFESAVVDSAGGKAWLRYASASQRFSIFQQRAAGTSNIASQKVDGGWYRVHNGSRLLIAGAPGALAQRILESVR